MTKYPRRIRTEAGGGQNRIDAYPQESQGKKFRGHKKFRDKNSAIPGTHRNSGDMQFRNSGDTIPISSYF